MRLSSRSLVRYVSLAAFAVAAFVSADAAAQTTLTGGQVVNETWTMVGSPYIIQGDLVVPAGSFLHIEAGVDVQIANGDLQSSLPDNARVAISVLGAIQVNGTQGDPVTIHAQAGNSIDTWHGIEIDAGATEAKFTWMTLEHARNGIVSGSSLIELSACELATNNFQGVVLNDGAALFDRVMLRDNDDYGVRVNNGTVNMSNVIALENGLFGFFLDGGTVTIHNSAAHDNGLYGINVAGAAVDVLNTLSTQNGSYGVYMSTGSADVVTSNVWGNATSSFNTNSINVVDAISTNPQYVNAGLGDLSLQSTSVCIDRGVSAGAPNHDFDNVIRPLDGDGINAAEHDIGPYEYIAMPVCGDAQLTGLEVCDDGAANGSYGFCNIDCTGDGPRCGDGNVDAGFEDCDDGNTTAGDGCDGSCMDESSGTGGSGGSGSGAGGTGAGGPSGSGAGPSSGAGGNASGAGGGSTGSCLPGEQIACACPGGAQGVQSCNDSGTGYGSCACTDNGNTEADGGCSVERPRSRPTDGATLLFLLGVGALIQRRRRA